MLRLVELILLLVPFAVVVVWRVLPVRGPSTRFVAFLGGVVALLAGTLLWLRHEDAEPPNEAYVPSHIVDGRVLPSGEAPK